MSKHAVKIPAFRVYERTSAKGTRYFLGYFGALKLIGFLDQKAESHDPCWQFFVQEQDKPKQPTTNGARDHQATLSTPRLR